MSETPIARHQNVAQHVSSTKQISTKTAERHAHARSYHHARKVLSVTVSRAWRSAHIWEKQICLELQQQQSKAMPSGFSHFYCHRV